MRKNIKVLKVPKVPPLSIPFFPITSVCRHFCERARLFFGWLSLVYRSRGREKEYNKFSLNTTTTTPTAYVWISLDSSFCFFGIDFLTQTTHSPLLLLFLLGSFNKCSLFPLLCSADSNDRLERVECAVCSSENEIKFFSIYFFGLFSSFSLHSLFFFLLISRYANGPQCVYIHFVCGNNASLLCLIHNIFV